MAPEERRAALVSATIPLLHQHGLEVSTRQIAQAAGVAEGTIFGVFADKNSLVVMALIRALDPQPTLDALDRIDRGLDLRLRMIAAANRVNERFRDTARLVSAARMLVFANEEHAEARKQMANTRERLLASLTAVIEPDAHQLRRPPCAVAGLLLLMCGANWYGPYGDPARFDGAEMVSLLLDGLLVRTDQTHDVRITGVV
jgi:AcrR family transcriptional regulator